MNFNILRTAYKDIKFLLAKYKNCTIALSDPDMDMLCRAFDKLKEINDHSAITYVYETLQRQGVLPEIIGPRQGELQLYILWIKAQLKFLTYAQGGRLLAQALERFPDNMALQELHVFYMWFYDTAQLDSWIDSQPFPNPVPEALLTVYGEHLIRKDKCEQARALAFMANTDPRRRHDLALLMVNAATENTQKLLWFNQFLAAQNMAQLAYKSPEQGFLIDNFVGVDTPRSWPGDQPLVSVITTAYKCADFLETSASSILNQSYRNLELLIIDDCSDDATRAKIQQLTARDPRVMPIFRSENGGTYIAKSEAMARAKGEFVIFHDADDWAHPDKIWREVSTLQSIPELACWCSGWARIDETGEFVMQLSGKYAHPNPAASLLRHPMVYARLGGFDSVRTGADSAYKRRIQLEFGPRSVRTDPSVLVLGRHHRDSLTQAGHASMGNFSWSPTRALYRGNWIDPMIVGGGHSWAPLSMRKVPIKIAYQAQDVLMFDPMHRLGLDQEFDDFLLIIQGKPSPRHLTQIHRLVMGLHQTGYRVGVYFEEHHWAKDTWQAKDFQHRDSIHCYGDLRHIHAKIYLLVNSTTQGTELQILARDLLAVEGSVKAHRRTDVAAAVTQNDPLFLLPPDLAKQLGGLSAIPLGRVIVLTPRGEPQTPALEGSPFGQINLPDPSGQYSNALLLTGPDWDDEARIEAIMLARYLGRRCLQTQARLAEIPQISGGKVTNLPQEDQGFTPLALSTPTLPKTGNEFIQTLAETLSQHLETEPELNLRWLLELPATGL